MVCKIVWSQLAINTYGQNIAYLQKQWTQKEVDTFIIATDKKLTPLSHQPNIGVPTNQRANLRKTQIVKRILLIYRYNSKAREIELVQFFNTWQHPTKRVSK